MNRLNIKQALTPTPIEVATSLVLCIVLMGIFYGSLLTDMILMSAKAEPGVVKAALSEAFSLLSDLPYSGQVITTVFWLITGALCYLAVMAFIEVVVEARNEIFLSKEVIKPITFEERLGNQLVKIPYFAALIVIMILFIVVFSFLTYSFGAILELTTISLIIGLVSLVGLALSVAIWWKLLKTIATEIIKTKNSYKNIPWLSLCLGRLHAILRPTDIKRVNNMNQVVTSDNGGSAQPDDLTLADQHILQNKVKVKNLEAAISFILAMSAIFLILSAVYSNSIVGSLSKSYTWFSIVLLISISAAACGLLSLRNWKYSIFGILSLIFSVSAIISALIVGAYFISYHSSDDNSLTQTYTEPITQPSFQDSEQTSEFSEPEPTIVVPNTQL